MKKLFKILFIALTLALASAQAQAALTGEWKIYPTFQNEVYQAIETPTRVYFSALARKSDPMSNTTSEKLYNLFFYDKEADEIIAMSKGNYLTRNLVRQIAYNFDKKYLIVVYDDLNIDFIYDDGRVINVATLAASTIPGNKKINGITFYPKENEVYLATHFGYVKLNDEKHEIAESRNYGEPLNVVMRMNTRILLSSPTRGGLSGYNNDPRFSLDEYYPEGSLSDCLMFAPFGDNTILAVKGVLGNAVKVYRFDFYAGSHSVINNEEFPLAAGTILCDYQTFPDGLLIRGADYLAQVKTDGSSNRYNLKQEDFNVSMTTLDFKDVWFVDYNKGLRKGRIEAGGGLTVLMDYTLPNSPDTFACYSMEYQPSRGMVTASHGFEGIFRTDFYLTTPLYMSVLKDGFWKKLTPDPTNPNVQGIGANYTGLAFDPDNSKYVYRGSHYNGLIRVNLEDPTDIMLMTRANYDNVDTRSNFVAAFPTQKKYLTLCRLFNPQFDNNGDLYFIYSNQDEDKNELCRWSADNRKRSVNAESFRPFERYDIGVPMKGVCLMNVGKTRRNANKFVIVQDAKLYIYDNGGTPATTGDDKLVTVTSTKNQDGGTVSVYNANCIYEDPSTGMYWLGITSGVVTFNADQITGSSAVLNRIKVSRNDGTSLADYLLNEVPVNHITSDNQGRKWFSTTGAGLVCTSSDGRNVLGEFTTDNSLIPSNNVYSAAYNPATNSIMVSTECGMAEFFPSGSSRADSDKFEVRAYPNPVTPDYYGYVNIDGLPDGVLVKVVDAAGGLVRELGIAESGSIQWNLLNLDNKQVKTGVYYILVSGGPNGLSGSSVGKVMVVR